MSPIQRIRKKSLNSDQFMKNLIRGYVRNIYQKLDKHFNDMFLSFNLKLSELCQNRDRFQINKSIYETAPLLHFFKKLNNF